jgi:hypothetical protein
MKKRWIIGLASTLVVLGVGGYVISNNSHRVNTIAQTPTKTTSANASGTSTNTSTIKFTGHWTPAFFAQMEQQIGKQAMIDRIGTIDPFKIVDGMQFKLESTTDPTAKKDVGRTYTFKFVTYKHDGEIFPILMSLKDGKSQPLLLINTLSAVGWSQYFAAEGVSTDILTQTYNASPEYIFECMSGSQSGKTMIAMNFTDWNSKLKQADSTMKDMFVN